MSEEVQLTQLLESAGNTADNFGGVQIGKVSVSDIHFHSILQTIHPPSNQVMDDDLTDFIENLPRRVPFFVSDGPQMMETPDESEVAFQDPETGALEGNIIKLTHKGKIREDVFHTEIIDYLQTSASCVGRIFARYFSEF